MICMIMADARRKSIGSHDRFATEEKHVELRIDDSRTRYTYPERLQDLS